jgi:sortase (surface protein transpeptidase)
MNGPKLDNPEIYSRLRNFNQPTKIISDVVSPAPVRVAPVEKLAPAPVPQPIVLATQQKPPHKFRKLGRPTIGAGRLRGLKFQINTRKVYGIMAGAIFALGAIVTVNQLKVTNDVHAQTTQNHPATHSNTQPPDETAPKNNYRSYYSVPPTQPKFLDIEKISVSARVVRLGVDSYNQLEAPRNIYDTGWYENSSKPGDQGGAILLDGHVSGPTKHGVFYRLKELVPGDNISITRGDDQIFNFKVVKTKSFDDGNVDMASALVSAVPGKLGLNLMTCTGKFDSSSNQYKQRLIVYAVAN